MMTSTLTDAMLTLRYNLGPCDTWPEDVAAACRVIDAFVAGRSAHNPMPAPALGMRAWYSRAESPDPNSARCVASRNVEWLSPGATWPDLVGGCRVPDIDLIADFRTGEVLWRKS